MDGDGNDCGLRAEVDGDGNGFDSGLDKTGSERGR